MIRISWDNVAIVQQRPILTASQSAGRRQFPTSVRDLQILQNRCSAGEH
jgi:hypothetical protein